MSPERRLLVSVHDVGPKFEAEVDALAGRLTGLLGRARFAMLVVPDHWGEAPLAADKRYQAKLRRWAEAGVEMFVHGWFHRDDSRHSGALARVKARHMTAGEGEFLGLERAEALRRMRDGRRLIEDATGRAVAGFVAPAWLYGDGARAALGEAGFALAEDHLRVWRPGDGAVLAKGPVITWASRSGPRIASSLLVAGVARQVWPWATVRIAVHPGDTRVPRLLDSIDRTIGAFAATHRVGRYGELTA
ncbi:MAG TPA: polysaccharide deacetylase family protein [Sphingomonas sp.]|nr:polysaccharide deacetylase family protein [Sphingomonas sp.]